MDNHVGKRHIFLLLALLGALMGFRGFTAYAADAGDRSTDTPADTDAWLRSAQTTPAPLCRFGLNVNEDTAAYDLTPLRLGWYINYGAFPASSQPGGMEHAPMIHLEQTGETTYRYEPSGDRLQKAIEQNPGATWFIGNEPDRIIYQDDIEPDVYARAYHDLYVLIKSQDPEAKVAAGSIVQPTELRLRYLDEVLESYRNRYGKPMPVDVWSIHNFILNEASCDYFSPYECWGAGIPPGIDAIEGLRIDVQQTDDFDLFVAQVERFRQWMAQTGYRDVPLYLSEYGVLMPAGMFTPDFTPERVNDYMAKTFDYLRTKSDPEYGNPNDGNRLVQRFSWYSLSDSANFNGHLFDPETHQRSAMGDHFAAYAASLQESVDFYPVQLSAVPAPFSSPGDPMTVTVRAKIANSGNTLAGHPVTVRFYDGDPEEEGAQIGTDQEVVLSGCGDTQWASVVWTNVPAGTHQIYVVVEPEDGTVLEPADAEANNTMDATVALIVDNWMAMPIVYR